GPELRQARLLHRIVLPASNPSVLVDSLNGWLLAEGLEQTLKVIPGEHWVRVDLCLGECSDSFSAVSPELGPRTPAFLAFAARGEGLYVRRWRLREFFAVRGLIGLFEELGEVSAEERVPLSFALHRRVLSRWSATGPKPGDVMDQSVLVDEEGDDWRLIESHAESGASWDVPEVYLAGGAGHACLDRLVLRWLKEKPEELQLERPAEREDLECATADPVTRLLAEEMRWMRLRYRARRLALIGERSRGLVLLKEACEQGLARACEMALAWHAQAEPALFASELNEGFAPPAFGLVRRVLLDRAGRLRGAEGLEKGEPFQLWIDRRCPWRALAPQLVALSAGRVEPRVPVALRDPVRGLRLLSIWLEGPKKEAGRKLGGLSRLGQGPSHAKTSTRVELVLDGLKLQFRGPGGQVVLSAPAACRKIDCWNLDALKKLLTDDRIEKLNPRFFIQATGATPWENVATLMLLLRELGAEILVNPRVL
ncbi:MAG: hypothetical protein JRF33_20315, partial [Deltaproteobacteria bacterium]|nr:hypothetical protein [Deltaproteobacteria bacterium]